MLPAEGTRVDRLLCKLGCCRHLRALAGSGKSQPLTQWMSRAGQCWLCEGITCLQMSRDTRAGKQAAGGGKCFQHCCSTGRSESYRDKPSWSRLGIYIANCSFKMELAYLRPLLEVAILQRSAGISETESCRNLWKDHNWFLKYYQSFDNPESLKKKPPKTIRCFVRPTVLRHIVMSNDIFSMRIIC